jgi:hypothetical protein
VFEHALSILKDMGSSQESDIKRRA